MQVPKRKPGKYTHKPFDPMITQEKYDRLEKKLHRLEKVELPAAAKDMQRTSEFGDFSENVEYQLAKHRIRQINNSITKIRFQLDHSEIIPTSASGPNAKIQIGSTVTVKVNGKEKQLQILGSVETNPFKGIISHSSPIGEALIGKKAGDVVEITVGERVVVYTIVSVA